MPQNPACVSRFNGETLWGGKGPPVHSTAVFNQKAACNCKRIILTLEGPKLCEGCLVHYWTS